MPAPAPAVVDPLAQRDLVILGERLRRQRQTMRIAAASVARAANMSRQTLHRIERGEPSVTMGAYVNALRALGLELQLVGEAPMSLASLDAGTVHLASYPQLAQLVWHRKGETVNEPEAFAIYERNGRHIDWARLEPAERDFIARLSKQYGNGALLV